MKRRVYNLPDDLLAGIGVFQKRQGHSSEVEAVRSLLAIGITASETEDQLESRLLAMEPQAAVNAACTSPLTSDFAFHADHTVVTLRSGRAVRVEFGKG